MVMNSVNSNQRMVRAEGYSESIKNAHELSTLLQDKIRQGKVIGIGSPRASLEANFALQNLVGKSYYYSGLSDQDQFLVSLAWEILQKGPAGIPSLKDIETSDAAFILGEDILAVAPRVGLAIRQLIKQKPIHEMQNKEDLLKIPEWHDSAVQDYIQNQRGPLFVATCDETGLDEIATQTYRAAPEDLARLGFAVAHILDASAPEVSSLSHAVIKLAEEIATALRAAKRPIVITGTHLGSESILKAAANISRALCKAGKEAYLAFMLPEWNSFGVNLISGNPYRQLTDAFQRIEMGEIDSLIVLENDLYRRADYPTVDRVLTACQNSVLIDSFHHEGAEKFKYRLPASAFTESMGSVINYEGRIQRYYQVAIPREGTQESWRWVNQLSADYTKWNHHEDLVNRMIQDFPVLQCLHEAFPSPQFRIASQRIPRQPHRYSGRTAMHANTTLDELPPPEDWESPMSFSMEGYDGQASMPLIARYWAPGWNSVQASFRVEVGGNYGIRIPRPKRVEEHPYYQDIPHQFEPLSEEWLAVPAFHVFGSEEMSALAPAIQERSPGVYVGLHPEDGERLKFSEGQSLEFVVEDLHIRLPVRFKSSLPRGILVIPIRIERSSRAQSASMGTLDSKFACSIEGRMSIPILTLLAVLLSVLTVSAGLIWLELDSWRCGKIDMVPQSGTVWSPSGSS